MLKPFIVWVISCLVFSIITISNIEAFGSGVKGIVVLVSVLVGVLSFILFLHRYSKRYGDFYMGVLAIFLVIGYFISLVIISQVPFLNWSRLTKENSEQVVTPTPFVTPAIEPVQVTQPQTNNNKNVIPTTIPQNINEYGKVKQVSKYEYNANFGNDSRMATPNEILTAVNNYRNQNGSGSVSWDDGLATWAQSRASLFATNDLDQHAGFNAEIESKAQSLGLKGAGEDSFLGGSLEAVHLIEWTFAQDEPHKAVLLGNFNVVGIGVASGKNGYGVDLIFGRK